MGDARVFWARLAHVLHPTRSCSDRDAWRRRQVQPGTGHCCGQGDGQGDQAMSNIKMRPFDMANYLGTEEEIVEYLRQALEDNDPAELAAALGDIRSEEHTSELQSQS